MELTHVEQMALFEGLMDAEYRKLKRVVVSKRRFSQGASISISRMADAIVKWRSEPAFTSTAGGMSGMDGTMICTIAATILPRKDRSWSLPGICKKFISPYWNSRTKPRWSCFLKYGIKREAHMILKYLLQRLVVPP